MLKYLLALSLLLPLSLLAQSDSLITIPDSLATVPFVAYWAVGDVYKFDVKKIDIRTKNDEETKNDTSSYTGVFEVIDSTETSYRIRWTYEGQSSLGGEYSKELYAAMKDIQVHEVIYSTDELGAFNRIENLEELQAGVKAMVDAILNGDAMEIPDSVRAKIEPIMRNLSDPAYIQSSLLPEIQLIHYPYGVEYVEQDTVTYDELLPNAFGGDPIKATSRLYIDSLDVSDDYVHLKQFMNLDETDAKQMLTDLFTRLGAKEKEISEIVEDASYKIRNDNDYHFYYYPGIPIYIDYFRDVKINVKGDKGGRIMRTLIEWVE